MDVFLKLNDSFSHSKKMQHYTDDSPLTEENSDPRVSIIKLNQDIAEGFEEGQSLLSLFTTQLSVRVSMSN